MINEPNLQVYRYRTRERRDRADIIREQEQILRQRDEELRLAAESKKEKSALDMYLDDTSAILSATKRLSTVEKKLRKCNTVLDEVQSYQLRMRKRKEFSYIGTPFQFERDLPTRVKPANIDADLWKRFMAFEQFDKMRRQKPKKVIRY